MLSLAPTLLLLIVHSFVHSSSGMQGVAECCVWTNSAARGQAIASQTGHKCCETRLPRQSTCRDALSQHAKLYGMIALLCCIKYKHEVSKRRTNATALLKRHRIRCSWA